MPSGDHMLPRKSQMVRCLPGRGEERAGAAIPDENAPAGEKEQGLRKRGRVDGNHGEIVSTLRKWGVSVQSLADIGGGCPDLLCSRAGVNYLLEIKDETQAPSKKKLTPDEKKWHAAWAGQVAVVETPHQALNVVFGVIK